MRVFSASLVLLLAAALSAPPPARACGGFFCSTAPINQSAERILYAYEADGSLTMAVEVTYSGFDDDFAWIVPVPVPPSISLGTAALFDAVDGASRPTFVLDERVEGTCRSHPRCVREGEELTPGSCGSTSTGGTEVFVETPEPPPPAPPVSDPGMRGGVTIFSEAAVGPYDTVVLGAATALEVTTWLGEHGYDVPAAALPLLEPYAVEGHVFVALRLNAQRASSVLRPIVMRMPAPLTGEAEACLPIRLTAIASTATLPIVAYFLGDRLVTSRNYSLAEIDFSSAALFRGGYAAAVSEATDRLGGQAFAVDYAGRMPLLSVSLPSVSDLADVSAQDFLRALVARGYRGDAVLRELFDRFVEPPAGADPTVYYNCLAGTLSCPEPAAFDAAGLARAIEANITAPRSEAEALLRRHRMLTRLSTDMSPAEMTVDPVFVPDEGLPESSNVHRGTVARRCSSEYFREDAPIELVVGATRSPWSAGVVTSDAAYCARFDAEVSDGVASGAAAECGYGCSVLGTTASWAPLLLLAVLPWLRRRRL